MTLLETQRKMAAAVMAPLTAGDRVPRHMAHEAASFLKPNARLTALERLEIYSRSYWFRLIDSLRDDFPGLLAVLGKTAFERLAKAYLTDRPSQSFTLRDLGSRLEAWLREHPTYAGRNPVLALDMVRLEWAHIVAFDGPIERTLGPEDLIELTPALRAGVQPYISLLQLDYAVDELRIQVNAEDEGATSTSNVALKKRRGTLRHFRRVPAARIFVVVHRLDLSVYYRRLSPEEFALLEALRAGKSIGRAIQVAFQSSTVAAREIPELLRTWFAAWARFGWLSARRKART